MIYLETIKNNIEEGNLKEAVRDMVGLMATGNMELINIMYNNFNEGILLKKMIKGDKLKISKDGDIKTVTKIKDEMYQWNLEKKVVTINELTKSKLQYVYDEIYKII